MLSELTNKFDKLNDTKENHFIFIKYLAFKILFNITTLVNLMNSEKVHNFPQKLYCIYYRLYIILLRITHNSRFKQISCNIITVYQNVGKIRFHDPQLFTMERYLSFLQKVEKTSKKVTVFNGECEDVHLQL